MVITFKYLANSLCDVSSGRRRAMEVIKTFTALPKESQNFIIDTLKADYAAGQLPDAERVKQRAAELATQSGYLWIPSGDWVYKFRRETLKVPKRPYG